jgi:hypothetical protein
MIIRGVKARASILAAGFVLGTVSLASAQQQQGGGQQPPQIGSTPWVYSATPKLFVDSWGGHKVPNGYQLSEFLNLGAERENVWYSGDDLYISGQVGAIENHIHSAPSQWVYGLPADTTLNVSYSNFDNKTHGISGNIFFNLPTGNKNLSRKQSRAVPNEDVVSHVVGSEGFNTGFDLRYHWQRDVWHYFVGGGYTFRGSAHRGFNFQTDGGHEITATVGGDKQLNEHLNAGLILQYSQLVDISHEDGGNFALTLPVVSNFDKTTVEFDYVFSVSTKTSLVTEFGRNVAGFDPSQGRNGGYNGYDEDGRYFRGIHNTFSLTASRDLTKQVSVRGLAEASIGDTPRSNDPSYFPTKSRYAIGAGSICKLRDNLNFETEVRFFQVAAKDINSQRRVFTGTSAFASLRYIF